MTALDRVDPRARRGGRVRVEGRDELAGLGHRGGAASVEISPEVSRP
ncbi:hypothetical protein [Polyangium mundeleinium]|uniref:Uncharacterized protein n=1 Tax=Polyangium mundeleinium TaxID=2995306 RepID=A0ABT5EPL8_9BACT|nr:hypothetical protein [Polyangium mundeleinium]MDC0743118.1 hypothetical protein [Polyangium mundeleinium]